MDQAEPFQANATVEVEHRLVLDLVVRHAKDGIISGASLSSSSDAESAAFYSADQDGDSQDATDFASQFDSFSWCDSMSNGIDNLIPELDSSWAGEFQAFGSPKSILPNLDTSDSNLDMAMGIELQAPSEHSGTETSFNDTTFWEAHVSKEATGNSVQRVQYCSAQGMLPIPNSHDETQVSQHEFSLKVFERIMQPPAAMLMGGIKKWRNLQRYLVDLGSHNKAVMHALLCLDKILEWDSLNDSKGPTEQLQGNTQNSFKNATRMIQESLSSTPCDENDKMDEWLATTFLLAWIQVLRDSVEQDSKSLFPSELADIIITSSYDWNWYSRQLLSWFNSLDSKASHLSGPALLSAKSLKVVSRYPIQIISCDYEESKGRQDSLDDGQEFRAMSASTASGVSEHGDSAIIVPALSSCDVKEIVLRAILQPAAEWYLETQAYCRQISALDKHHQKRFTPDTEIKVALAGKRLHNKLWDLWAQRPSAISLTSAELSKSVAPDVAARLQEISSVYLASFWILFVYLHRVCWWHLSHTGAVSGALEETWKHMQNSYGEEDKNSQQKTVHPALMWPVFLFGAECKDEVRRSWAIGQLQALSRVRPVLKSEEKNQDTLPAFRMSQGATRNAKRAALLLEALIKKQDEAKCRVDDRDLAMDMFGCYFSIV
ncbi:hypothetical protein FSARC_3364 [Fusarium sarcochroum]|uniref:Uncharacterized protein n=1 Tax=Fusarium sarcochroum TaxID=1208366 RepID=A0A8H4U458_9HYPO|nr:hypothetical protein FSARC_3364 [Fusarium sarcochroum]